MELGSHLELKERIVAPAGEWKPDGCCWATVRVAGGFGYCFEGCLARELQAGHALIASPNSGVILRASRLGELRLEFFYVMPQRLTGIITAMEWRQLETLCSQDAPLVFHYAPDHALARKFAKLAALRDRGSLLVRTSMLQSWSSCIAEVLPSVGAPDKKNLVTMFRRFLSKISENELATISITEMAAQLNSSERHLSRLFRSEFGMSLRQKQTELSMQRACELLMDPGVNIRNAAYRSGYRHTGLFNVMFKKRFGVTPKEWRQRQLQAKREGEQLESPSSESKAGRHAIDPGTGKSGLPPSAAVQNGILESRANFPQAVAKTGQDQPAGGGGTNLNNNFQSAQPATGDTSHDETIAGAE